MLGARGRVEWRSGALRRAALQVLQILRRLLQRKSEREKSLDHVARQAARQALTADRGDFLGIGLQSLFDRAKRWRTSSGSQGIGGGAKVGGDPVADFGQRRRQPRLQIGRQ